MSASLLNAVLLALALIRIGHAQGIRPSLNLFASGRNEATFYFVVGDGERQVSLVTNPIESSIVSDPDSNVTGVDFVIQGAQGSEKLLYNLPGGFVVNVINGVTYSFERITLQSLPSEFSFLSTVKYDANLSVSSLSQPSRNITVTARDAVGAGPSSVIHLVLIPPTLYPPVFSASSYSTTLFQNTTDGTVLAVNIVAVDPAGWPLTYSIQQPTPNAFVIDPQTGVIRIKNSSVVNTETARTLTLTVLATDSPLTDPPKTGTATVNVVVLHRPYFKQDSYVFSTPSVGQVSAVDLDGDVLTYSFATPQSNFVINSASGALSTAGVLTLSSYTFVVLVTDGVYVVGINVTVSVTPVVGVLVTPVSSTVNILLDTKTYSVYLSSAANGAPLVVQDTTANLVRGTAVLTAQVNGTAVSHFATLLANNHCDYVIINFVSTNCCTLVFANEGNDFNSNEFMDIQCGS